MNLIVNNEKKSIANDLSDYSDENICRMYSSTVQLIAEGSNEDGAISETGTGVIYEINEDEIGIISCYHVIEYENTYISSLNVVFIDGSKASGYVKGYNIENDLILLSVKREDLKEETFTKIMCAQFSECTQIGQRIYAVGNSMGNGISITNGIISALNRNIPEYRFPDKKFIQVDAAVNKGNSGGALFDEQARCLGIISTKFMKDGVENMAYAIPSVRIVETLEKICLNRCSEKKVDIPYNILIYGMSTENIELEDFDLKRGFLVSRIENKEFSFLKKYDIIYKIDYCEITTEQSIYNEFKHHTSGDVITVYYYEYNKNGYKEKKCKIKLK